MAELKGNDPGLSPRDRFAVMAMNGLLAFRGTDRKPIILGRNAYELADAMMAARGDGGVDATLRDRIAELALNGLLVCDGTGARPATTARLAFEMADAMLAARTAE
jgi:hypothetical protein